MSERREAWSVPGWRLLVYGLECAKNEPLRWTLEMERKDSEGRLYWAQVAWEGGEGGEVLPRLLESLCGETLR